MKNTLLVLATLFGIFLVFYFSWLPNPDIGYKSYFPEWLGQWTNANANLRTAVPFLFLGTIAEIWFYDGRNVLKKRTLIFLAASLVVTAAEVGQLFLPKRTFDLRDIGWGIAGTVAGILIGSAFRFIYQRYNRES